jgi:outer membrane cobalamin receptor
MPAVTLARPRVAPALIELACADPEQPCPLPFALGDDPPLDPVTAVTSELGARWQTSHLSAALSYYRTNVSDDIFLFPYNDDGEPEGSTIDGFFANIPRTRREGLQAKARIDPLPGIRFTAAGAITRATFQTDDVRLFSVREGDGATNTVARGDRFPLVPDHVLTVGLDLFPSPALSLGAGVKHVGTRYLRGDEANEERPLSAYATVDAHATASWHGLGLRIDIANLLNEHYAAFGTFNINQGAGVIERFITPGAPRAIRLSVSKAWGGTSPGV